MFCTDSPSASVDAVAERMIFFNGTNHTIITTTDAGQLGTQGVMQIGCMRGIQSYMKGTLDEVRIFNFSLSQNQIYADYVSSRDRGVFDTLVTDELTDGAPVFCNVTPSDGNSEGTAVASPVKTIGYIPPAPDVTNPTYSSFSRTTPANITTGTSITYTIAASDDVMLHSIIYMTNATGTWINKTTTRIDSNTTTLNTIISVERMPGTVYCSKYWMNDTTNNINTTNQDCFTVQSSNYADSEYILILITILFIAFVMSRYSHILADISYFSIGVLLLFSSTSYQIQSCGVIIALSSIVTAAYDTFK